MVKKEKKKTTCVDAHKNANINKFIRLKLKKREENIYKERE